MPPVGAPESAQLVSAIRLYCDEFSPDLSGGGQFDRRARPAPLKNKKKEGGGRAGAINRPPLTGLSHLAGGKNGGRTPGGHALDLWRHRLWYPPDEEPLAAALAGRPTISRQLPRAAPASRDCPGLVCSAPSARGLGGMLPPSRSILAPRSGYEF